MSSKPRDRGRNCYLCQIDQYRGFSTAAPGRGLEVVPSLTALRHDRRDSTPGPSVGGLVDGDTDSDVGVNVRWALTPDLVANLALNPDFSQVEADVAQLDVNNQFALFFQETRPFFLEAAEFFSTPINAVFTRTVADPDIGAKVTGTLGANTFGVFAAEDKVTNLIAPGSLGSDSDSLLQSSRTMVSRYRRNIGESSTIGALVTARSGDGYDNTVAGIDGRIRAKDRHSFIFQLLHSETEYPTSLIDGFDAPLGRFGGDAIQVNYDYGTRNWAGFANYERYDPQFRADSGFITQVDYERQVIGFRRTWHGDGSRWWDQLRTGGNASSTYDLSGQLLGRWREIFFGFQGPLQSFSQMGVTHGKQFWNGTVYETRDRWIFGQIRPVSGLQIQANLQSGDQIDFANSRLGKNIRFSPQINWNANRHLLLGLQYTKSQLDDRTGSSIFDAELIDLRMTWQFNVRSFLRLTMQQQDVSRNVAGFLDPTTEARSKSRGAQLLYSYELNPQTVIFAGYSDNHLQNSQFADLTKTDRTFFLKLSYAWLPK
jgi:hypothetical protein